MGTLKDGIFPVKKCTKCGETKLAIQAYFSYHSKSKDHLNYCCKECVNLYNAEYRKNNKEKIHAYQKGYNARNKEKIKKWHKDHPEKMKVFVRRTCKKNRERRRIYGRKYQKEQYSKYPEKVKEKIKKYSRNPALFLTHAARLTIEEDPKDDGNGKLLVRCAYCGKYFYPTVTMVRSRTASLLGRVAGENRLYCSDGCKQACPIYNQHKYPKGYKKATSREVDPLIRQLCLKRDDYTCQKCEKTIDEIELHSHHIEGATQMPMLANDVDNTITLCIDCHKWVHKQKDCTYYDLRCK